MTEQQPKSANTLEVKSLIIATVALIVTLAWNDFVHNAFMFYSDAKPLEVDGPRTVWLHLAYAAGMSIFAFVLVRMYFTKPHSTIK